MDENYQDEIYQERLSKTKMVDNLLHAPISLAVQMALDSKLPELVKKKLKRLFMVPNIIRKPMCTHPHSSVAMVSVKPKP